MHPNAGGKILEEALANIGRSRNAHMLRSQLSTREVEGLHQAGAAVPFPLENPAVRSRRARRASRDTAAALPTRRPTIR